MIDKNHHRSTKDGVVYEHVLVAERVLGRNLFDGEVVHHIDLNKLNNDETNLIVFHSKSDHTAFHRNGCDTTKLILNSDGSYSYIKSVYQCRCCGVYVYRGNDLCPTCAMKLRRKVERPNKEYLVSILYANKGNFTLVGK